MKSFFISSTVLLVRSYLLVSIIQRGLVLCIFEFKYMCVCSSQILSIRDFWVFFDVLMFLWVSILVYLLNVMYLISLYFGDLISVVLLFVLVVVDVLESDEVLKTADALVFVFVLVAFRICNALCGLEVFWIFVFWNLLYF